jgi:two-component system heavy metal sensor histidine kinase CusS
MKSFRLRLALLAGVIAAALLLCSGYYAWRLSVRFNLDRLDRELRNLGAANLERVVGDEHWRRVESALRFVSGADQPPAYALWVENHGRPLYRSPHWPGEINAASLPRPDRFENGVMFASPPPPPRPGEPISPRNPPLPRREPLFLNQHANGSDWRVAVMGTPYTTLVLAAKIDEFNADVANLRFAFLGAAPIALLLVGGAAWFVATRALRPVAVLTQATERVTAQGLDQRLPTGGHSQEFHRLVTVFNEMMNRLERSFHQATRFSADASHELKAPLALLQAELEQALATAPAGSAQQQTYSNLLDEVVRLKAIIHKLLLLSLADAGRLELRREPTDLRGLLRNVMDDCVELGNGLEVQGTVEAEASVLADAVLLQQALLNLATNAVKFNRPGGKVAFNLATAGGRAEITVGNTGAGIDAADHGRVFERFFRGDKARSHAGVPGAGLGLSLSREILRAHGGDLVLLRSDADWTEFRASLPLARG